MKACSSLKVFRVSNKDDKEIGIQILFQIRTSKLRKLQMAISSLSRGRFQGFNLVKKKKKANKLAGFVQKASLHKFSSLFASYQFKDWYLNCYPSRDIT